MSPTGDPFLNAVARLRQLSNAMKGDKLDGGSELTAADIDLVLERLDEVDGVVLVHDPLWEQSRTGTPS